MDLARFTVCTISFRDRSPAAAFAAIRAAGFDRVDLFGVPPHFSVDPAEVTPESLEAACAQHGVRIANLGTYCGRNFHTGDAVAIAAELELSRRTLALARRFGCRTVRTLPGEDDDPAQIAVMAPHFRALADTAEELGVDLVMENHHGRLAGVPALAARLCEAVGSPRFGVIYEPCNLLMGRVDVDTALDVMAPWVRHVHFKDGRWVDGKFERCHYGDGEIDIKRLIGRLDALGYAGDLAVEYEVEHLEPVESGLVRWRHYLEAL